MERLEAIQKIRLLQGQDLRTMADQFQITVTKNGKPNKGWAGHVIERYLGLPLNSSQSPNFGSWELKVVPLYYLKSGVLVIKETMAITMIDPYEVSAKTLKIVISLTNCEKCWSLAEYFEISKKHLPYCTVSPNLTLPIPKYMHR